MTATDAGRGTAVGLALAAALLWGLWWIPVRALEALGLAGAQAGAAMNVGAALAAGLWVALRRRGVRLGPRTVAGAALAGIAVSSYSAAINHSDVVRVVLLFYLAPAWSKLIEYLFLGLPWRGSSTVAILASLCGAVLVLGGDLSLSALNYGDLLALGSGMAWAAGAAIIFTTGRGDYVALTFATCGFAALAGIGLALAGAGAVLPAVTPATAIAGLVSGMAFVLPIMALTLWSAQRLPPATLSFLLTAEILAGVISGAVLLGEPFGPVQAAGAALIVFGAVAEVLPALTRRG